MTENEVCEAKSCILLPNQYIYIYTPFFLTFVNVNIDGLDGGPHPSPTLLASDISGFASGAAFNASDAASATISVRSASCVESQGAI